MGYYGFKSFQIFFFVGSYHAKWRWKNSIRMQTSLKSRMASSLNTFNITTYLNIYRHKTVVSVIYGKTFSLNTEEPFPVEQSIWDVFLMSRMKYVHIKFVSGAVIIYNTLNILTRIN